MQRALIGPVKRIFKPVSLRRRFDDTNGIERNVNNGVLTKRRHDG